MNVTLEKIDQLRERANIGYKEAKEALIECDGDMVEALIYVEENYGLKGQAPRKEKREKEKVKKKRRQSADSFADWFRRMIWYCNNTRFVIFNKYRTVLDIPLTAAIMICFVFNFLVLLVLATAVFTDHKIKFIQKDEKEQNVTDVLNKVSDTVSHVGDTILSKVEVKIDPFVCNDHSEEEEAEIIIEPKQDK